MEASRQSAASSAPVKRSVAAAQACRQGGSSSGLRGGTQSGDAVPYTAEISGNVPPAHNGGLIGTSVTVSVPQLQWLQPQACCSNAWHAISARHAGLSVD